MMRVLSATVFLCLVSACATSESADAKHPVQDLGEPTDDIDPDVIGAAVRENPTRFQRCYEAARERNPSLSGLIEVRFLVNKDGSVGQAQAAETDLPSGVAECVVNAFYDLRLPQQERVVIAQYPMFFEPG